MKQVMQNLANGDTEVIDSPVPQCGSKKCLIKTSKTLISAGTEKMLVNFGKASYLQKAKQQPDKVKEVLNKIKTDGLLQTIDAVKSKLDQPLPLGYCNVGTIAEIGLNVSGLKVGDRVVSNGQHAEMVSVSPNLCAKIPDNVGDEAASFTVIGAIALQGIRLANPTLGECFVVAGLGLVGLMAVQLLIAHGCSVIGLDFDQSRCDLAQEMGATVLCLASGQDPVAYAEQQTEHCGVDGVIITASTQSSEPISQAAHMCRKRGRIIMVGVTGMELSRADFYEKELSFQVSCSYGPGRYDAQYEDQGIDYPLPYVRWTEQRNFEAVLQMIAMSKVDPTLLISHRFDIENADQAYALLTEKTSSLAVIINYPQKELTERTINMVANNDKQYKKSGVSVGAIGAGNYASRVLLPAFKQTGARLVSVATSGGFSGVHVGKKLGFEQATTDNESIFSKDDINTIIVATPHNKHADLVVSALNAGKHVFVEKPLALTLEQLEKIKFAYEQSSGQHLMVGFNRRFSPFIIKMKQLLSTINQPKSFVMTVNAGHIPPDHWTQNFAIGGGRIIGEACHFIDLLRHLAGVSIASYHAEAMQDNPVTVPDTVTITLKFIDGSIGTIHYFANGHKGYPKEKLQVFAAGKILEMNNYRSLIGNGWKGFKKMRAWRMDKGQQACASAFVGAITEGKQSLIPFEELFEVSRATIAISTSLGYNGA
ncbi:MAG: bi-domain-containing oxidoreductase [Coxiellaceae bacterium]|nr:bi-domain-containing oxidoreductase [Coxiellaceae bacterium]